MASPWWCRRRRYQALWLQAEAGLLRQTNELLCFRCVFFDQRRLCCAPPLVRFQQLGMGSHKVVLVWIYVRYVMYITIYARIFLRAIDCSKQCRRRHWQYIGLGLAKQTKGQGTAQHSTSQNQGTRKPHPRAIAIAIDRRQVLSFAPSFAWLPRRPVPFESRGHSPPEPLHHPTTSARARHYHQLDRCHRRRQQTIIHHRPTLTSIFSVVCSHSPHTHHQLRCAFAAPTA